MERMVTVLGGNTAWRQITHLAGWNIPDEKSPEPTQAFVALGATVNHIGTPSKQRRIQITSKRRDALVKEIDKINAERQLGPFGASWDTHSVTLQEESDVLS